MRGAPKAQREIERRQKPRHESPAEPAAPAVSAAFRHPLFWGVLALKVVLGCLFASHYLRDLFTPFLNYFVESRFSDPWTHFHGMGRLDAFPYPPVMLYALAIPRVLFAPFLAGGTETVTWLHLFVMRLPLLACDAAAFLMLVRWFPTKQTRILAFYWCSPITIYVSYWHGQLDVIPTTIFMACLSLIYAKRFPLGWIVFAVAAAAKSHLFAAGPVLLIYTYQSEKARGTLKALGLAAATYAFLLAPFAVGVPFREMVYGTAEQLRLYALDVPFGSSGTSFLIGPASLLILWFRFAAYPKWNWDLFMLYLGLLFCVFVLLIPPAPGYFFWSLPFVVFFLCRIPKANVWPYWCYTLSYLAFYVLAPQGLMGNLVFTLMQTSLLGMMLSMYLYGVRSNSVYSLRAGPVMIGLAGDSGCGKDTFVHRITDLLGAGHVTVTSGDDYHRWPRGHAKWSTYTHLDVRGNDLYKEQQHALALLKGGMVVRRQYNHDTGKFTEQRPVEAKRYLVFSGLHSLSLESMRSLYDLKVFMDPDEALRREWKISRDSKERKASPEQVIASLSRRQKDREKYILPQRDHADLIIRFAKLDETRLKLELRASNSFDLLTLAELLADASALSVEHDPFFDSSWQTLSLSGEIAADTLLRLGRELIPNLEEIAVSPRFVAGLEGCVQLVFLACLSQKLLLDARRQASAVTL